MSDENRVEEAKDTKHTLATLELINESIKSIQGKPCFNQAHYLPADRGGVMRNRDLLVRGLIRSSVKDGKFVQELVKRATNGDDHLGKLLYETSESEDLSNEELSPTGVLADYLEKLPGLKATTPDMAKTDLGMLSKQLEKNILHGAVKVKKNAVGYPIITYQPDGWKNSLSMMNVSSMVAELAPVVLYLQQIAKPGDLLILEEPETNLHPAMQQEFIREIATWVQAGLKVLITTHSDWIINELSNCVARQQLSEVSPRKKIKYPKLSQDMIGVYVFDHIDKNKPTKGATIKEMKWNSDEGGFDTGFYDVAMDQHEEWVDTSNGIVAGEIAKSMKDESKK